MARYHQITANSYYEAGKSLGSLKASEIKRVLGDYKSSDFRCAVLRYLATEEGQRQYKELNNTVRMRCAEYVDELQGVADGSDCDYNDLFEMNVDCEMTAAIELVPVASHGVSYLAYMDGCTNVSIQTPGGNVYFGHTEDISPQIKDLSCMVTMEIRDGNNQVIEHWTDFVVPGLLPGSKFGFNKHGVMFGHNNVYQQGLNAAGIRFSISISPVTRKRAPFTELPRSRTMSTCSRSTTSIPTETLGRRGHRALPPHRTQEAVLMTCYGRSCLTRTMSSFRCTEVDWNRIILRRPAPVYTT